MESPVLPPEGLILLINLIVLWLGFKVLHPRMAGKNIKRLLINDLLASCCALLVAGSLYSGSGIRFSLIFIDLGWFGFTLITYSLMEIPFFKGYLRKHNIDLSPPH